MKLHPHGTRVHSTSIRTVLASFQPAPARYSRPPLNLLPPAQAAGGRRGQRRHRWRQGGQWGGRVHGRSQRGGARDGQRSVMVCTGISMSTIRSLQSGSRPITCCRRDSRPVTCVCETVGQSLGVGETVGQSRGLGELSQPRCDADDDDFLSLFCQRGMIMRDD